MDKFSDWDNPLYYNIVTFKALEARGRGARRSLREARDHMRIVVIGAEGQAGRDVCAEFETAWR